MPPSPVSRHPPKILGCLRTKTFSACCDYEALCSSSGWGVIQGAILNTEHYDARELKMLIVHMLIRERAVELQFSGVVVVVFDHSLIDCVRE